MYDRKDIILAVNYHAENIEIRWFNCASGEERRLNIPTTRIGILRLVEEAIVETAPVGGVFSSSWPTSCRCRCRQRRIAARATRSTPAASSGSSSIRRYQRRISRRHPGDFSSNAETVAWAECVRSRRRTISVLGRS